MIKRIIGLGAITLAFVAVAPLSASVVYNTGLLSPSGTSTAAAVYYGTGNAGTNFGWTVDTEAGGIEVGLQALLRFLGPITPDGTGNYVTSVGQSGGLAPWNFAFSVDLQPAGSTSTLTLSDINATITITDANGGSPLSGSIFVPGSDNALVSSTNYTSNGATSPLGGSAAAFGAQNSENLGYFAGFQTTPFNFDLPDVYTITLAVTNLANAPLASSTITVQTVTPEPSTWLTLGTALAGLAFFARRRRTA